MFALRTTLTAIAATLTVAAITACGSSSSNTTDSSGSAPTHAQIQRFQSDAIKFTHCMHTHGIASFPDPPTINNPSSGRSWKDAFANQSPGFVAAATACQHFLPRSGAHRPDSAPSPRQIAAMLAFARCIRSHGFANFPDPTSSGITHQMVAAAGLNLHQPAVLRAADACVGVTHGYITRAVVARFVAGQ
ncbi:MAG: hypothetical protein ACRDPM_01730 [Solirubrobacteraceae bacterium]